MAFTVTRTELRTPILDNQSNMGILINAKNGEGIGSSNRVTLGSSHSRSPLGECSKKVGEAAFSALYSTPFTLCCIIGCVIALVFSDSDLAYYALISAVAFATQALCSVRIRKREQRLQDFSPRTSSCCGPQMLLPAREAYSKNTVLYGLERWIDESVGVIETGQEYFPHPISRISTMVSPLLPKLKFGMGAFTVSMVAFIKLEEFVTTLKSEIKVSVKDVTWKVYLPDAFLLSAGLTTTFYLSHFFKDSTLYSIFRELGMAFAAKPIGFHFVRMLDKAIFKLSSSKKNKSARVVNGLKFLLNTPSIPTTIGFALKATFLDLGITEPFVGMFLMGLADGAEGWNNYCIEEEFEETTERIAKSYSELAILCLNKKHIFTTVLVLFAVQDFIWPDTRNPDNQPYEGGIAIAAGLSLYYLCKWALSVIKFSQKTQQVPLESEMRERANKMVKIAKTILLGANKLLQLMIWSSLYLYEYRKYDKRVVETILCLVGLSIAISQFNVFHYRPNSASPGIDVFPGR